MPPERIDLNDLLASRGARRFARIAERIDRGAVFIYPTETIYGIGGRYDSPAVLTRILSIKQRPTGNAMILLAADVARFEPLNLFFPPKAKRCAEAFWPGPLTMVLTAPSAPDGIAIRVSNHPFIGALGRFFIPPIFSTSANISGDPYRPDPETIYRTFGNRVDFMIDAGTLPSSPPSTVVRFIDNGEPAIVREGCIPASEITSIVNR
ncbi:MAG: threonylcarbamoyl-AMP synthase [Chitinispirillaceae bacterium]|nr:threonylcarbamoyl-AMP synthase [Chitinispirillaceae bacterium]